MISYKIKMNKKRCISCRACEVHCKVRNRAPVGVRVGKLSVVGPVADKNGLPRMDGGFLPCLHCRKPECLAACPTGAIIKRPDDGIVYLKSELCDGCGACIPACPFGVPEMNPETGKMIKCDLCMDRLDQGLEPACVTGCTGKALKLVKKEKTQGES